MRDSTRQGVTFTDVFHRPVAAAFDEGAQTSDAGLLLLGALDRQVHLTAGICAQLSDARAPGKVDHSVHDLLRQRVYGIAAGYADCNDARTLLGFGWWSAWFLSDRQFLQDRLAGTRLIRA